MSQDQNVEEAVRIRMPPLVHKFRNLPSQHPFAKSPHTLPNLYRDYLHQHPNHPKGQLAMVPRHLIHKTEDTSRPHGMHATAMPNGQIKRGNSKLFPQHKHLPVYARIHHEDGTHSYHIMEGHHRSTINAMDGKKAWAAHVFDIKPSPKKGFVSGGLADLAHDGKHAMHKFVSMFRSGKLHPQSGTKKVERNPSSIGGRFRSRQISEARKSPTMKFPSRYAKGISTFRDQNNLRDAVSDLYRMNSNSTLGRFKGLMRRNMGSIVDHPLKPRNLTTGRQRATVALPRNQRPFYKFKPYW